MSYRCEVEGCRGNAPCAACLAGLSLAVRKGLAEMLRETERMAKKTGYGYGAITDMFVDAIKKELDAYWAKTIGSAKPKKSRGKK